MLADQGLSFTNNAIGTDPQPTFFQPPNPAADRCNPGAPVPYPVRFRPKIPDSPITQAVPVSLAGSPVTTGIVNLAANGWVSLYDSDGNIALMVQADQPFSWPQYFGILAAAGTVAGTFTLSVVFNPQGGAPGVTLPVTLETFPNLPVTSPGPGNAVTQLNSLSKFVHVPKFVQALNPGTTPTTFPPGPTRLSNTGLTSLEDGSLTTATYLIVEPTNSPASWPLNFGVLAQGDQENPTNFNLVVAYNPPAGGVGVQTPVVVELFNNVSLATVTQMFSSAADLVSVMSFDEEPSPSLSAYDLMNYDANQAVPEITLAGTVNNVITSWTPQPDLLADGPTDTNFVVEIDTDGTAYLRFGDDTNGLRPESGTVFTANYRIGNGTAGNVGANSLVFFAGDPRIARCTNPLPATGGSDPETNDQIRRRAPQAFMTQERAITMADYEAVAERNSLVENAVATLRWTGSWYTVFISAEPKGAGNLTASLSQAIAQTVSIATGSPDRIFSWSRRSTFRSRFNLTICVDPGIFQEPTCSSSLCGWCSATKDHAERTEGIVLSRQLYLRADRVSQPYLRCCAQRCGRDLSDGDRLSAPGIPDAGLPVKGRNPAGAVSNRTHGQRSQPP